MAGIELETLTADVVVSPYTGLTAIQRQQSGIARAQVTLRWDQTTLSSTTSGNVKGVRFTGELPRNFAYVYYGGSLEFGRTAQTDVLNQISGGCHFENIINCNINSSDQTDSWTMEVAGTTEVELVNLLKFDAGSITSQSQSTAVSTADNHFATPGHYDPYSDIYKKIYNDVDPPKIIYRATEDDITINANVACMVLDPFPSGEFLALGRMHFLQYDIDQAYNYLIHSPIPVR